MRLILLSLLASSLFGQTAVPLIITPSGNVYNTARGAHTLTLDGSTSTCSGGCLYAWRQTAGDPIVISGSTTSAPSVTGVYAGQYTVELIVTAISGGARSAPVSITFSGVATDNQNVTTPSSDALTAQLVGSHVRAGYSPWPTADYRQQFMADYYASLYGGGSIGLWPAFWETDTPLTGTLTIASSGATTITGDSTQFQTDFWCNVEPSSDDYIYIIIRYNDATQGGRLRYLAKHVVTCPSNNSLTLEVTGGASLPVGSGFHFTRCTTNQRQPWTNLINYINYYDNVVSHYMMYARSGLERHRDAARWLASKWITNPFFNMGQADGDGFDASPRNSNFLGLMLYASDGHPEVWPYMNYRLNQSIFAITRTDGDTLPPQDAREYAYALWPVAVCAKYHTDVTPITGQRKLCLDAVNATLNTHIAPYIQADGAMYNWYTDPAYLVGPTGAVVNIGDTIITSTALLSGVVNTSGTTVTGTSGSTFDSGYVNKSMLIGGVAYNVASVSDGTHLTLTSSAGSQAGAAWAIGKFPNTSAGAGVVNTSGASVTGTSGTSFDSTFVGLQFNIASVAYTVLSVADATHLTLTSSAGTQTAAAWVRPTGPNYYLTPAAIRTPGSECSGPSSSLSMVWFTVSGNRQGDTSGYRCSWLDSMHIQLATPYAVSGSGSGTIKYWQLRWDNEIGVGAQPFMQGIATQAFEAAYEATGDSRIPNWIGGTTSLATFLQTTGYRSASFGLWYGRVFPGCEPDPMLRTLCNGTEYEQGEAAGDAGTRFLLAEAVMGVQYGRNFFPANTPQSWMTLANGVMWAEGGGPMTSGGFTDPNTAPASVIAYKKSKDNGYVWGVGGMSRTAAYFYGGYAGSNVVTRKITFGSPSGSTSIQVKYADGTSATTACPASPCSVSVDATQGAVYRILRGSAYGDWVQIQ